MSRQSVTRFTVLLIQRYDRKLNILTLLQLSLINNNTTKIWREVINNATDAAQHCN